MSTNTGERPWPQTLVHDDVEWPTDDERILVPFHEGANVGGSGVLAGGITFGADGELYLLQLVGAGEASASETAREQAKLRREVTDSFDVPVESFTEELTASALESFIDSYSITTTVIDEDGGGFLSRRGQESAVADSCHTVVGTGMDTFESPASILVPVAKGPHSGLVTKVAAALARAYDCWLELFHVIPEDAPADVADDAEALLDAYEYRLDDEVEVDHFVYEAPDPADAIIEHSDYHDLTILGAPQKGKLRRFLFGSTTDEVKDNVRRGAILTVHRNRETSAISRWL